MIIIKIKILKHFQTHVGTSFILEHTNLSQQTCVCMKTILLMRKFSFPSRNFPNAFAALSDVSSRTNGIYRNSGVSRDRDRFDSTVFLSRMYVRRDETGVSLLRGLLIPIYLSIYLLLPSQSPFPSLLPRLPFAIATNTSRKYFYI